MMSLVRTAWWVAGFAFVAGCSNKEAPEQAELEAAPVAPVETPPATPAPEPEPVLTAQEIPLAVDFEDEAAKSVSEVRDLGAELSRIEKEVQAEKKALEREAKAKAQATP